MRCNKLGHRSREDALYFQIKTALKIGDERLFRVYKCTECGKHHITYKPHFDGNKAVILIRVSGRLTKNRWLDTIRKVKGKK